MAVHPGAVAGAQDWPGAAAVDGAVDSPGHGGWQRHQHYLAALPCDAEHPVAVFLAEVGDVGAGGLEDPQPEQAEHRDQGEVVEVGRLAGRGEQRLELQVGQPQGG